MANTVKIENLSEADQELAPGSGFIPAHGFRVYPADEYSEKHEKYAKARLEADPPILKVGESSGDDEQQQAGATSVVAETLPEGAPQPAAKPGTTNEAQRQTDQNAADARKQEEQQKLEQERQRLADLEAQQSQTTRTEETRRRR